MYAILSDGELVALCDKPRYVKKNDTGIYVEVKETEADGVSVNGDLYNLHGGDTIKDAPQAVVKETDGAEYIFRNHARISEGEQATGEVIFEVENALCELDTAADERMTAIEDALCEIDKKLKTGGEN